MRSPIDPEHQSGNEEVDLFLNPYASVSQHSHRLPHWQRAGILCFVTWRLADSLPHNLVAEWKETRDLWLRAHPQPWDASTKAEYREQFSARFDCWLDQGIGSCALRDPRLSQVVADAICHFDGDRYELASFVVMPNHVHVLFRLRAEHRLQAVVKSWKGYSARRINQVLGRSGALWGQEYRDRLIRSSKHFEYCVAYIRQNPEKASLADGEYVFREYRERFALDPLT